MIRADVRALLGRWREMIAAAALGAFGLWTASFGGYVLVPLGAVIAAVALGWAVIALRRLRFQAPVDAPGIVEVDEGQVGYFGPTFGGVLALGDVDELRLTQWYGRRQWRLRTGDGQVLSIPEGAAGAERLFDAFASLPGLDPAALTRARAATGPSDGPIWRRGAGTPSAAGVHHENS